jgi:hypothetical protein
MVDANCLARPGKMNNLSSDRHAEFIMQLIIFLMGPGDSDRTVSSRHVAITFLVLTLTLAGTTTLARAQDKYEPGLRI